ncbi:MAG: DUF4860 domain-containing protein [Defluviitaleaceae bacterium]|nr:DUF4860 domain-containing protein [Defluviitaleaceae bacterium]
MANKNRIDTVFVLTIFAVFAASVLLVIMLSGSTFANITEISQAGQHERILLSYIRTKIRNTDNAGAVSVGYFNGISALFLEENLNNRDFVTVIYLYDGLVRELFHEQGNELSPEEGVAIISTDSLIFEAVDGGLIRVCTDIGSFLIFPRSSDTAAFRRLRAYGAVYTESEGY